MPSNHVIDAFLKVDGIAGESTDEKHVAEIEIVSFRHGVMQGPGSDPSTSGNLSAGRCEHHDFSVVKTMDIASAPLYAACCSGKHIPTITLSVHRAGGSKVKYFEVKLTDVLVSSINYMAAGNSGELPNEEITFKYGRIDWTYTKTKLDGSAAGNTVAFWDLKTNKGS
jgi:type VI secretion system secreted protein Hcp